MAAVRNAKLMEGRIPIAEESKDLEEDEVLLIQPISSSTATSEPLHGSNMTMAAFARSAGQVLEPLPFITRDSIASLVLMTDGVFGNMTGIAAVVSQVLNMANLILSSFPFGALLPILVQVVLNVLMAPQTRYFAKYALYRIWLLFPASSNDRYVVQVNDNNVIVTSASDMNQVPKNQVPNNPTSNQVPNPFPAQPTLSPLPQLPQLFSRKK